jgi:MSHA biogenesis protein MshO
MNARRHPGQHRHRAQQHGVTLVELVVVLTIIGLVVSIGATLVGRVVGGQQDNRGRLTLAMSADGALARIADELTGALPNSLRVAAGSSNPAETWIEFVPVDDAGRYRAAPDTVSGTPGDVLDFEDASDNGFDVIGTPITHYSASSELVLRNLGPGSGADAYVGDNRRGGLVFASGGRHVAFTAAGAWPASTGTQRFFIAAPPVSLACVAVGGGFELRRYSSYGWLAAQPTSTAALAAATATLLQGGLASCSASYSSALANIGLLNLRLGLADGSSTARMEFMQQLAVDNTP